MREEMVEELVTGNQYTEESDQNAIIVPERRLIASVLQRALADLLSMFERTKRAEEVASGQFDLEDQAAREYWDHTHIEPRRYKGKDFSDKWKARELIRWFESGDSESPMTFLWILRNLNLDHLSDELIEIIHTNTIEDHPSLTITGI